ncbi:hypothetical protein [Aeromicrobium chenweiae]|uniref:hypothetical protein n=1 Tax=Aeromicrobium chenweiae TaxID=2079793 RepID=UPI0010922447|nr:hypothetical protein [Aeromicrobium chenweiae]
MSYSSSGSGGWATCGMEPRPSGARYVAEVAITQTDTPASDHPDSIESALRSDGWTIEQSAQEVVEASQDGLELRARTTAAHPPVDQQPVRGRVRGCRAQARRPAA